MWDAYAYMTATQRSAELRAYLTKGGDKPSSPLLWIGAAPDRAGAEALVLAAHAGGHVCDHDGGRWSAADVGFMPDWVAARERRLVLDQMRPASAAVLP